MRPVDEPGEHTRLVRLVSGVNRPFDGNRLTQRDGLFALADVPPQFLPARKRCHRAGLQAALQTLRPREQLITDAVAMELLVGARQNAGFGDGGREQVRERLNGWSHGPSCRRANALLLDWQEPSANSYLVAG